MGCFLQKHRAILDADIMHVRRPDGRDYDGILHVNPALEEKGLLILYNPLPEPIERDIKLNLYYTGLEEVAEVMDQAQNIQKYSLDKDYTISLPVTIPAKSQAWFVIK